MFINLIDIYICFFFFFFQAEDGIRDLTVTGVQTCALPISVTFEFTKNWKFTILNNENVWAKAMNRVVTDKWTPEKAVDEMRSEERRVGKECRSRWGAEH